MDPSSIGPRLLAEITILVLVHNIAWGILYFAILHEAVGTYLAWRYSGHRRFRVRVIGLTVLAAAHLFVVLVTTTFLGFLLIAPRLAEEPPSSLAQAVLATALIIVSYRATQWLGRWWAYRNPRIRPWLS